VTSAPGTNSAGIDADFTTQLLYCATKNGVQVNITDLGLNVLYDLVDYAAQIDAIALAKADGKNLNYAKPMSISEMTAKGNTRG